MHGRRAEPATVILWDFGQASRAFRCIGSFPICHPALTITCYAGHYLKTPLSPPAFPVDYHPAYHFIQILQQACWKST